MMHDVLQPTAYETVDRVASQIPTFVRLDRGSNGSTVKISFPLLDFYSSTSLSRLRSTTQLATHGGVPQSIGREVEKKVSGLRFKTGSVGLVEAETFFFCFPNIFFCSRVIYQLLQKKWPKFTLGVFLNLTIFWKRIEKSRPNSKFTDSTSGGNKKEAFGKAGFQHKGTTFFICVSRPAHALISASGEKKKQKNFKENASLWTSSRGQVLSSTGAENETDCSTQTVLWRLVEKVNLLVKVVLGSTSLFTVNHGPASLDCYVCRFYWSTGAAQGPIMVDPGTCLRGEIPKKVFSLFVIAFGGPNIDLDREEGAGGPTIARSLSCARSFAMSVSVRSLVWRERESQLKKAAEEICSSGLPLFVF